ncbi:hypothetical protein OPV22_033695 [Ensete ventricosum]|uniref:Uncharacterized protein n=1 Tax=Ensete ventricosum TaxID=4639 RepID=A0AAV8Q2R0_ENSVE|nr:hypothetical protein OPV22_033695 [Ensete ventricosum]
MSSSGAIKGSGGKGKGAAVPDVKKKVDGLGKSISVVRQKPVNVVSKLEGKKVISSSKTVTKTTRGKAVKKVYALPGQKYDIPEEREPLRIFYESLSKQIPSSEMAEFWMMEHGLLSPERAKKAYERKQKRQQQLRTGTPIKSSNQYRPGSSKSLQASRNEDFSSRKRIIRSNDDSLLVKSKKIKA